MRKAVARLMSQVDNLSTKERADLAHYLLQSLSPEPADDTEAAWEAELTRRITEIENGTAKGRPVEEVLAELRIQYP